MWHRPRSAGALTLLLVLALSSCSETDSPLAPGADEPFDYPVPSLSISDGAHAGNEHFYFLAPLVKGPKTAGIFDPIQSPVVEICELGRAGCVGTIATYTTDSGPVNDRIAVDEKMERYEVDWDTRRSVLAAGTTVRVQVRLRGTELGHLDVLLIDKGNRKATGDHAKAKVGTIVEINFRIEEGVIPPSEGDIVLHDNVVPVDSTVLTLVSTESELAAGTYRFDVIGSPVPDISVGDVLAGPQGLGFMRIVTSAKVTGKRVVAETTQADLSDIIKAGSFSVTGPLDFSGASNPPPSGSAVAPLYYMAPGVSASDRLFTFNDVNLCVGGLCPEWLDLKLLSGYVDLSADVSLFVDLADSLKATVKGDLVFDVTARAVAEKEFTAGGEKTLAMIDVPLPRLPVPLTLVKLVARVRLKVGYDAAATATARVQSGLYLKTGVELGGLYVFGSGWTPVWQPSFEAAEKETSWVAQGDGHVRVYVRPEIQILVSAVEGPFMGLEPYLKAYGSVGTEDCRVRLTRGTDAEVVLQASVANKFATDTVKKRWPGEETELVNKPCKFGHLKVVTTTSGTSPDPDGYTVTLDGIDSKPALINGTVVYSPLPPTTYNVGLSGLAENCSVTSNPRSINVTEGDTVLVAFPVTCGEPETGILQVNTMTTGQDDGYTATTDGASPASQPIGIDGQVTFDPVITGDRTVELTDLGPNCVVAGDNPRTVTVTPDATASTNFDVTCGLTVNVTTIGSDFDPDGYSVIEDGGSPGNSVDINGSVWIDIAAGMHDIELTDLESGCRVLGDNPRDVDSPGEENFDVSCGPAITDILDFNVWQILPDGNGLQQLTTDGGATNQLYSHVKWSPDGTRMVFTRTVNCASGGGECAAIFTADPDGSNAFQVTFPESGVGHGRPDWSPDGTKLVVYHADNRGAWKLSVMTVNPDGTDSTLVKTGDGTTRNYAFPSWTPDGRIVYVERVIGESGDDGYVAVMDADGSGVEHLTSDLGARIYEPDHSGNRIAFKRKFYDTETSFDLMVMNADGSGLTNLTNQLFDVSSVELSPDGSQIAYALEAEGGLWIIDADGSNNTMLTGGGGTTAWRTLPSP